MSRTEHRELLYRSSVSVLRSRSTRKLDILRPTVLMNEFCGYKSGEAAWLRVESDTQKKHRDGRSQFDEFGD